MSEAEKQELASWRREVEIPAGEVRINGDLILPHGSRGVVLFAHGSGSSRKSPRNQWVARTIRSSGIGTLLFDLLTSEEEAVDMQTRHLRFDIEMLAERLTGATRWLEASEDRIRQQTSIEHLRPAYFGASTGAAAALLAAAALGERIAAVVSRGGRPDLAGPALSEVKSPTLLIVGGRDETVLALNQDAFEQMTCEKELKVVRGATHLFEEPGALDEVARLATNWFRRHLLP